MAKVLVQKISTACDPNPNINISFRAEVQASAKMGFPLAQERVSMKSIATAVCAKYGISMEALKGPCRSREFAWPRQEAMWLMRQEGRWSLPQIGRFLGWRDYTTVLHGCRAYEKRNAE